MKLYYGPASPYVRMVRATALAKGLSERIDLVDARADGAAYEAINPLNKMPALATDDGEVLIESRLICQYLDGLGGGPRLYPSDEGPLRRILQRQAIVHGVLDAAILRFNEARRPESQRSPRWDVRQKRKIDLGLASIEAECAAYTAPDTILPIMLGCLLGFIDRAEISLVPYGWREPCPALAAWFDAFSATPLMAQTEPAR